MRALWITSILALAGLLSGLTAGAQTGVEVTDSRASTEFPNGLAFSMTVEGESISDVRLVYEIAPDGVPAAAETECTDGAVQTCTFQLEAGRRALLIPGAEVTYFWRITSGGETVETDPQLVVYEDTRFDWQTVGDGNLTVWWYDSSEEEARGILAAGREALDGIGALLQTSVDFPVKIFYYRTAGDMQAAIISDAAEGVVTLGEVVYSDTAMVSADSSPGDIARHEIAHIVIREALRGPFDIPVWLNEGTAVYAQNARLPNQLQAVESAIQNNRVLSIRSLSSSSSGASGSRVSLFYGQSWSVVNFLIEAYGEEQFAELYATFREGNSTAGALMEVYGFDQDGLENEWRASVGLPPRTVPTAGDPALDDPTEEPDAAPTTDGGDDGTNSTLLIALVIVVTAVVAGGIVASGLLLARRLG